MKASDRETTAALISAAVLSAVTVIAQAGKHLEAAGEPELWDRLRFAADDFIAECRAVRSELLDER